MNCPRDNEVEFFSFLKQIKKRYDPKRGIGVNGIDDIPFPELTPEVKPPEWMVGR